MLLLLYQKKIHVFKNYICPISIANLRVKGIFSSVNGLIWSIFLMMYSHVLHLTQPSLHDCRGHSLFAQCSIGILQFFHGPHQVLVHQIPGPIFVTGWISGANSIWPTKKELKIHLDTREIVVSYNKDRWSATGFWKLNPIRGAKRTKQRTRMVERLSWTDDIASEISELL